MKAEYTYTAPVGSPPVTADVYYTPSAKDELKSSKPVVILFHAGGFVVGNKSLVSKTIIDYLIGELGTVAVVPDYRLCPAVSVWEGPVTDAKACLTWVHDQLPEILAKAGDETIDTNRIATVGFSAGATLALLLVSLTFVQGYLPCLKGQKSANAVQTQAAQKYKLTACLAFYGELYWTDPFWMQPKAALAGLPVISEELYNQVYDEGVVVSAPSTRGPNGPDLTKPRNAWLLTSIKEGWWLKEIVKDGDLARIDPASMFGPDFPPTAFVHGTADVVSPVRFSKAAHASLQACGVDTALFLVPDKGHDFEASLTTRDADVDKVLEGLRWLSRKF